MQLTILEHDLFLWCVHDGQVVDPRESGSRVADEGYACFDRGAVFAPLFAGLTSPLLSVQEQAHPRWTIVDDHWTQLRKFRAARTCSPPCALCGCEEGIMVHRHFRCSEVQDVKWLPVHGTLQNPLARRPKSDHRGRLR